jgi:hypothetical protein
MNVNSKYNIEKDHLSMNLIAPRNKSKVQRFTSEQRFYLLLFLMLTNKFTKKKRGDLALLLLYERWVLCLAKANVPNERSRYLKESFRRKLTNYYAAH